jgi:tetratricopeptide (TPR) repeat protein
MKIIHNILAAALLVSTMSYAQKDEMKALKKIHDKDEPSLKDLVDYKALLIKAEPLVAASTEEDKVYFEYYNAGTPMLEMAIAMQKPENKINPAAALKFFAPDAISKITASSEKVLNFEKKTGKQVFTKDITDGYATFKPMALNYAIALGGEKRYIDASSVLNSIYLMDKKDLDKLYYAASYSITANDYDTALKQYNELIEAKYTGESTIFYAKNAANGNEESFNSKADRDKFVSLKTHSAPRDEKIPSKLGEIYKNIALIYVSQHKNDEAKKALTEARTKNPDDVSLIMTEANLYLELKDETTYKKLITEVLEKNPNDADLVYNLGVISGKTNIVEAEKYYLKAIAIDPKYLNAYLNLAIIKLDAEKGVITQMNKLGTTPADNKKYEVLKVQRQNIFKSAIPFLEKCVELDPSNYEAAKTLLNVYNALEIMDKAKALKAVVKELEANPKK